MAEQKSLIAEKEKLLGKLIKDREEIRKQIQERRLTLINNTPLEDQEDMDKENIDAEEEKENSQPSSGINDSDSTLTDDEFVIARPIGKRARR